MVDELPLETFFNHFFFETGSRRLVCRIIDGSRMGRFPCGLTINDLSDLGQIADLKEVFTAVDIFS